VKYLVAALIAAVLVGALGAVKGAQIATMIRFGEKMEQAGPPPETVGAAVAQEETWEETLHAVGGVTSVRGVTLAPEVGGVVSKINFESGDLVAEGEVVVELDTSVERAALAQAQARQRFASVNERRTRLLVEDKVLAKEQLDNDLSIRNASAAEVAGAKAQIERRTVRAPFAGRLGIRNVNTGQYVAPGTAITVLETIDEVYVDFALPQGRLDKLANGMLVRVSQRGGPPLNGQIDALEPSLDAATRSVRARANVPNKEGKLRPGMFVDVEVVLPDTTSFVVVPGTAVVHAAYGDSVFVLRDQRPEDKGSRETEDGQPIRIAEQRFVRTGPERGDFVAILEGIEPEEEVVIAGAFKLRNGARVVVSERALPKAEASPQPPNR
jgi:membrane fusion protein (multidrug efflux system)